MSSQKFDAPMQSNIIMMVSNDCTKYFPVDAVPCRSWTLARTLVPLPCSCQYDLSNLLHDNPSLLGSTSSTYAFLTCSTGCRTCVLRYALERGCHVIAFDMLMTNVARVIQVCTVAVSQPGD
jgi:hypothetical protein